MSISAKHHQKLPEKPKSIPLKEVPDKNVDP
jgi:hypothetical protein